MMTVETRSLFLTPKLLLCLLSLFVLTSVSTTMSSLASLPGVLVYLAVFANISLVLRQLHLDQMRLTLSSIVFSLMMSTLPAVFLLSKLH